MMFHAECRAGNRSIVGGGPARRARDEQRRDTLKRLAAVTINVDSHLVAILAAQEAPHGLAHSSADQVQQRRLDARDGVPGDTWARVYDGRAQAAH